MLILHTNQVNFCQVTHREENDVRQLDAFTYLGHLFVKGESFSPQQHKQALSRTQELLDLEEDLWGVLLREESGFSLWYCSGKVEMNQQKISSLAQVQKQQSSDPPPQQTEEKTESESSQNKQTFSKSILNRLKKEWEESFRLTNN